MKLGKVTWYVGNEAKVLTKVILALSLSLTMTNLAQHISIPVALP
jgi:hypothetical protein